MSQDSDLRSSFFSAVSRRTFLHGTGMAIGSLAAGRFLSDPAFAQAKSIVWYTGTSVEASNDLTKLFTDKTGIKSDYFRAGGLKIAQKFEQELKAGQVAVSAMTIAIPNLAVKWASEGLLMRYESPEFANYPEQFIQKGYAGPATADPQSMAYNTELINEADAPKTWEDLLDPKWKGKITMVDATSSGGALHWYSAMRKAYGKKYMERLAQQNVLVRTGGGDVVNTLVSGERPLAAVITQYHALKPIASGAPLKLSTPAEGIPINYSPIIIPASAPNPEGAKRFVDFVLSAEAQKYLQDKYFVGSFHKDVPAPPRSTGARPLNEVMGIASTPADMDEFFAKQDELTAEYTDLFK
jgi:iron(III) transport system substrate-binding protein